ncbi:MAG: ATP-binding protein [Deltaproteobacteria bacterium]|nr:ATP-binding protein [Deltaproteobacteria bacterium]MBM4284616.1 ATP-binding protein [Deltaproteobacteria bacterium]
MGIFAACRPRQEVLHGDLDDAIFAADFGQVIWGKAPKVYQDPETFLQNTHPAAQLKKIVGAVCNRLADPKEAGVTIRLSTGFGGGKTHTLMALWHLAQNIGNLSLGTELLPAAGRPPKVTVVAVDAGRAGVPVFATHGLIKVQSLWGEMFYRLGKEKALKQLGPADDPEASPDEALLEAVFPAGPVLVLLDELVIYLAKLSERGQGNLFGFLNSLASVVNRRPRTVLLVTDPAGQVAYAKEAAQLGESLDRAAHALDEIMGRRFVDFDPIGEESAQVIVRRLFRKVDAQAAQKASALYHALYERVERDTPGALPKTALSLDYAKRLVQSYPFHPRLLDTAHDRLGSLPDFQKSRGVLRLFARIIRDVWGAKEDVDLITAGELDWSSDRIQHELLDRLNREPFQAAVSADVIKKAGDLDGGARNGIHRRVASALLLESLTLQSNSGLDKPELALAVLRPDEAGPEPAEALDRLLGVCWHTYPMAGGRGWQFRYEPNVIKLIEERLPLIPLEDAKSRVQAEVQAFFGQTVFKLVAWPQSARQVPDTDKPQLVLCQDEALARTIVASTDETDPKANPRRYLNAILAVTAKAEAWQEALDRAKRLLAAEAIELDYKSSQYKLMQEQLRQVKPELMKRFHLGAIQAFNRVVMHGKDPVTMTEEFRVGEETVLRKGEGQGLLRKFLDAKSFLYQAGDGLDVHLFLTKVLAFARPLVDHPEVTSARALYEKFLETPGLRLMLDGSVVRQTIFKAISEGGIVVRLEDGRAYDAQGCVSGPPGHRERSAATLTTLSLDEAAWVTQAGTAAAQEWTRTDVIDQEEGEGPGTERKLPTQPPPGKVSAHSWEEAIALAATRPLLTLQLVARTPKDAAALSAVAQPLGAVSLNLDVTVSGHLKDGGSMNFAAVQVKPNHPAKPLFTAQTIFNSLEDQEGAFEALMSLDFGAGGRGGMAAALQKVRDAAPAEVKVTAHFDKPTGEGA